MSNLTEQEIREKNLEWRPVVGYEEVYEVNAVGQVRSLHKGKYFHRILKPGDTPMGYKIVSLSYKGKTRTSTVHRLVAKAFIPNKLNRPDVNHLDGDKTNNVATNLEWCNASENGLHAFRTGLNKLPSDRSHTAKLTWADVTQIREYASTKKYTQAALARMFNVDPSSISDIIRNKHWKV